MLDNAAPAVWFAPSEVNAHGKGCVSGAGYAALSFQLNCAGARLVRFFDGSAVPPGDI